MIKNSLPIILLFVSFKVIGQQIAPFYENRGNDTFENFEKSQIESLYSLHSLKIDPSYELINGRGYFQYYFRSEIKPILFAERNHSSSVTLNGVKYVDISLDFDTYTDELIYIDSTRICVFKPLMVAINKNYIDCFEFYYDNDTMLFRYFSKEDDPSFDLKEGFYEVGSDKESKYLIKHISVLEKVPGNYKYTYLRAGYVNVGNGFSEITGKRQFLKIFGDRSDEVRKFIKKRVIKIRKASKEQIISILIYYDSL